MKKHKLYKTFSIIALSSIFISLSSTLSNFNNESFALNNNLNKQSFNLNNYENIKTEYNPVNVVNVNNVLTFNLKTVGAPESNFNFWPLPNGYTYEEKIFQLKRLLTTSWESFIFRNSPDLKIEDIEIDSVDFDFDAGTISIYKIILKKHFSNDVLITNKNLQLNTIQITNVFNDPNYLKNTKYNNDVLIEDPLYPYYNFYITKDSPIMGLKPSDLTSDGIIKFLLSKNAISPLPNDTLNTNFKITELIPNNDNNVLLVKGITLNKFYKNDKVMLAPSILNLPNILISGFKEKPVAPPTFPEDQLGTISWVDLSSMNLFPFQVLNIIDSKNNELYNTDLLKLIQDSVYKTVNYYGDILLPTSFISDIKPSPSAEDPFAIENYYKNGFYPSLFNGGETGDYGSQLDLVAKLNNYGSNGDKVSDINIKIFNAKKINSNQTIINKTIQASSLGLEEIQANQVKFDDLLVYLNNLVNIDRQKNLEPAVVSFIDQPIFDNLNGTVSMNLEVKNAIGINDDSGVDMKPVFNKIFKNINIVNFKIPDDANSSSTTPIENVINSPVFANLELKNKKPSDVSIEDIQVFLFNEENLIPSWFKNLPEDYTKNDRPIIQSLTPNNQEGTLSILFELTYSKILGMNIRNPLGTSVFGNFKIQGLKKLNNFNNFDLVTNMNGEQMFDVDFKAILKSTLQEYINGIDNFSDSVKNDIYLFLNDSKDGFDNPKSVIIEEEPNIRNKTNLVTYKIPELASITGYIKWAEGWTFKFNNFNYLPNIITPNNQNILKITFEEFKEDNNLLLISDLINIKNKLPSILVGQEQLVIPTLKPGIGDSINNVGEIIFHFDKIYDPIDGLIENYNISFMYQFSWVEEPESSPIIFKDEISIKNLVNTPFLNMNIEEAIIYFNNSKNLDQINTLFNDKFNRKQIFNKPNSIPDDQIIIFNTPTKFNNNSIKLTLSLPGVLPQVVIFKDFKEFLSTTFKTIIPPPSIVNDSNVESLLNGVSGSELQNNSKYFIEAINLPEGGILSKAFVFDVFKNYDKWNEGVVALINFTYSKVNYTSTTGSSIMENFVVQIKYTNLDSTSLSARTASIINYYDDSNLSNGVSNSLIKLILIPLFIVLSLSFFITLSWFIKKYLKNK